MEQEKEKDAVTTEMSDDGDEVLQFRGWGSLSPGQKNLALVLIFFLGLACGFGIGSAWASNVVGAACAETVRMLNESCILL